MILTIDRRQVRADGAGRPVVLDDGRRGAGAWWADGCTVRQVDGHVEVVPVSDHVNVSDGRLALDRVAGDLVVHVAGDQLAAGRPAIAARARHIVGAPFELHHELHVAGPCYVTYDPAGIDRAGQVVRVHLVGNAAPSSRSATLRRLVHRG